MSGTPGTTCKLSPFGSSINKSLLTPCRRVGLSRKRKTPSTQPKLSGDLNSSNNSICENFSSENTPINTKPSIKRKNRVVFDNTNSEETTTIESHAKKNLNKCFKSETNNALIKEECGNPREINTSVERCVETINNKRDDVEDLFEYNCLEKGEVKIINEEKVNDSMSGSSVKNKVFTTDQIKPLDRKATNRNSFQKEKSDNEVKEVVTKFHTENTSNSKSVCVNDDTNSICSNSSSTNSSPIMKRSCKTRIIYDSDDDFKITENIKTKLKTYERKKLIEGNVSSNSINSVRDCKISLTKLSEEDIGTLGGKTLTKLSEEGINILKENKPSKNSKNISSVEENINFVKKKKSHIILSDDDDFQEIFTKSSEQIKTELHKKKSKSKKFSTENTKIAKLSSLTSSSTFEDDDDFTSTPDRQRIEKRELIDKVKYLEICVKGKNQKLDNLKRASIYKSKHNIDELRNLTEKWRQGCMLGLNGLLTHLQSHGPMDMPTLLNNLKLSDDAAKKVFMTGN